MKSKTTNDIGAIFGTIKSAGGLVVPENSMKTILASRGIPIPAGEICGSIEEASLLAKRIGYPVVIKTVSDRMLHKTEAGGVRVGITDKEMLKREFLAMSGRFSERKEEGFRGLLVEKQVPPGIELIAGLSHDDTFGPVLMLGLGGVFTDLFEDVCFRMLPLSHQDIIDMFSSLKGYPLLCGFRGSAPVDVQALAVIIEEIASFGMDAAPYYLSVDFNPIIADGNGATIVDAKLVLSDKVRKRDYTSEPNTAHLDKFFNPASVAVIGASKAEGKIGNVIIDSLSKHQYKGTVYPINPNHEELMGLKCYHALSSLPEKVDLIVVVVDLKGMPDILDEMDRLGIKNALIVSGGGKELGGDRAALEGIIAEKTRKYGIRIIGPNCIGSFDGNSRFDSFFHNHERLTRPRSGPLSFITQSGTWGCTFLEMAESAGICKMVSYGNRVDVDEGDLVAYLAEDRGTGSIGSYIEGLGDGRKFVSAVKKSCRAGKPVAVFKTGRNRVSAGAAVSHTGAYGGSYRIYEGVLKQAGAVLTDSFHELYAACEALAIQPPAGGPRAAMLSNGAGPMVNALDLFPAKGLSLAKLSRKSVESMRGNFSFFYIVENPVDVTGSATAADYEYVIRTMIEDENVDVIMPFFVFQDTPLDESIVERLNGINSLGKKPIIGCAAGGGYTEKMSRAMGSAGIPVFPDVTQWVAAASALVQWGECRKKIKL